MLDNTTTTTTDNLAFDFLAIGTQQISIVTETKELTPLQLAKKDISVKLNDELTSLSIAFKALRSALLFFGKYFAMKAKASKTFTFDKALTHEILNVGSLKALTQTFELRDALRVKWSPSAMETAFYKAIGIRKVKTVAEQLTAFCGKFGENMDKIKKGKSSQNGFIAWGKTNIVELCRYDVANGQCFTNEFLYAFLPQLEYFNNLSNEVAPTTENVEVTPIVETVTIVETTHVELYETQTKKELVELCKVNGLPVGGNMNALRTRLKGMK